MAQLLIEAETGETSLDDDLRERIDTTLDEHLPHGLLHLRWDGDVLRISGPGARGKMVFAGGRLRVKGTLKLPASLFQSVIEHKIKAAFADAFGRQAVS